MELSGTFREITEDDLRSYLDSIPESKVTQAAEELTGALTEIGSEPKNKGNDEKDRMVLWPAPVYKVTVSLA